MTADVIASIDGARPDPRIKGAMRWNPALSEARGKHLEGDGVDAEAAAREHDHV